MREPRKRLRLMLWPPLPPLSFGGTLLLLLAIGLAVNGLGLVAFRVLFPAQILWISLR